MQTTSKPKRIRLSPEQAKERFQQIHAMRAEKVTVREIARLLHMNAATVSYYLSDSRCKANAQ